MAASVVFYQNLGLKLIVDSVPRYCRFEFPQFDEGEPATLSLHEVDEDWQAPSDWPLIYFEVDDVDAFIKDKNLTPLTPAKSQSYLWREADILDPTGNKSACIKRAKTDAFRLGGLIRGRLFPLYTQSTNPP